MLYEEKRNKELVELMIEENTDILSTEEERKENELWFREYANTVPPSSWHAVEIQKFSKDFFREFKDKFQWYTNVWGALTLPAIYVRKHFGDEFFREMTGYRYDISRD